VQNLQVSQSEQIIDSWWRYPLLVLPSLATSMVVTQLKCLLYPGQGHRTAHSRANRLTERGISTDHGSSDPDFKFWCLSCTAVFHRTKLLLARVFLGFAVEWDLVRQKLLSGLVKSTRMVNCYLGWAVRKFIAPCSVSLVLLLVVVSK
jgi:hypothetical protein